MVSKLIKDTAALEPGDVQAGDYVRKPAAETEDKPELAGMVVADMVSAGWTTLYDTITREPSTVNNNMKAAQLKVRRPDGTLVFTDVKPSEGPRRGSIKCFLHEDQPDRPRYAAMGFDACAKATLPNQFQAENHARNKHRDEWNAVEAEQKSRERREDRESQQALFRAVAGGPPAAVAPVMRSEVGALSIDPSGRSGQCKQCDWRSEARKSSVRKGSLKQHMKTHEE